MPISILDMIFIGVVLISAILAMLRGFTQEILSIASWGMAFAVAILFYDDLTPFVKENLIQDGRFATPIAAALLFFPSLILSYFITSQISELILKSRIGPLDRSLGFIFGLARGFVIMVLGFGLFDMLIGDYGKLPTWVENSRVRFLLTGSMNAFIDALPKGVEDKLLSVIDEYGNTRVTTLKGAKTTKKTTPETTPSQDAIRSEPTP